MIRKNKPVETLNLSVSTGLLKANTQVDIFTGGLETVTSWVFVVF